MLAIAAASSAGGRDARVLLPAHALEVLARLRAQPHGAERAAQQFVRARMTHQPTAGREHDGVVALDHAREAAALERAVAGRAVQREDLGHRNAAVTLDLAH